MPSPMNICACSNAVNLKLVTDLVIACEVV